MKRVAAIAFCGWALSGCSSLPSMPSWNLEMPRATTTIQFESEPPGAEAKVSVGGGTCRTPCALPVASDDFTVTFSLSGYQPQTVPVRIQLSSEPIDPDTNLVPPPRLVPNPVSVELIPAPPPPAAKKRAPAKKAAAAPAATTSIRSPDTKAQAPAPGPAPAPAPAAAWPPPPQPSR